MVCHCFLGIHNRSPFFWVAQDFIVMAWRLRLSGHKVPGENVIALPGEGEILLGNSSFIMRAKYQRHFAKPNVNIRMVIGSLSFSGDAIDKIDAVQESVEFECPTNCSSAFRPVRDNF
jgi:hypothetical protein